MNNTNKLAEYQSKRDFSKTPEPSGHRGGTTPRLGRPGNPLFVIQQHQSSELHWKLRLESGGVLKSWTVPDGLSADPTESRLAVAIEDHPLDYADFEGVIPEGEYGAGTMLVWDGGPYRNLTRDAGGAEIPIDEALAQGRASVWLEGDKLRGGYNLLNSMQRGNSETWLITKLEDAEATARPAPAEPRSVLSGRTLAELRDETS